MALVVSVLGLIRSVLGLIRSCTNVTLFNVINFNLQAINGVFLRVTGTLYLSTTDPRMPEWSTQQYFTWVDDIMLV